MRWIDCNTRIGYRTVNYEYTVGENSEHDRIAQSRDGRQLVKWMDYFGIEKSVIMHCSAVDCGPIYGNQQTIREVEQYPDRLIASWVILPPITDKEFEIESFSAQMKSSGVKLLKAYPARNSYFLSKETMPEMLDYIDERRIPLYLPGNSGWNIFYDILREYPSITLVIHDYGLHSINRYLYPILKNYKNVHIETSDMQTDGALEEICKSFGAERLLFGTNHPVNNAGGPKAVLIGSSISEVEKELIACGNFERLLDQVRL